MAAAAASASQDELSKCGAEPAAASRTQLHAGPGLAGHWRLVGRGARARGRAAVSRAGGSGARAWREGGRTGGPPPRALVGLRFALSRREIETRALGIASPARNLFRPGLWGIPVS